MSWASLVPALKGLAKGALTWFSKPSNRKMAGEILGALGELGGGSQTYTTDSKGNLKPLKSPSLVQSVATALKGKKKSSAKRKKRS
jgi:hypothetical protein